jgi:hypothetical protein
MTCDRIRARVRVTMSLGDLDPSECARIRFAADALLYCANLVEDRSARAALDDFRTLHGQLVASGRWTAERARRLAKEVRACGPVPLSRVGSAA